MSAYTIAFWSCACLWFVVLRRMPSSKHDAVDELGSDVLAAVMLAAAWPFTLPIAVWGLLTRRLR